MEELTCLEPNLLRLNLHKREGLYNAHVKRGRCRVAGGDERALSLRPNTSGRRPIHFASN